MINRTLVTRSSNSSLLEYVGDCCPELLCLGKSISLIQGMTLPALTGDSDRPALATPAPPLAYNCLDVDIPTQ